MRFHEISTGNLRSYLDSPEGKERTKALLGQGYAIERLNDDGVSEFVTLQISAPVPCDRGYGGVPCGKKFCPICDKTSISAQKD
jgi:hypothetical protein